MRYRIGFDIGIASVGWSVIEEDEQGNPKRIADLGARTFDAAENLKDGSSLTVERRQARGARRVLRRKKARIDKAKRLFLNELLKNENELKNDFSKLYDEKENIYELRTKALDEKLTDKQLVKIFMAIIKHRGYKSNSKSEENEKETGKVLSALSEHDKRMKEKNWRSVGEYIFKDKEKFYENTGSEIYAERFVARNKSGNYKNTIKRIDLEREIKLIFAHQRKFGNTQLTDQLENNFLTIFNSQLDYDSGPNEPSPYRALYKVGNCTFEPQEQRAPKSSWTFSLFNFLQKINNIKLTDNFSNEYKISFDERQALIKFFQSKKEVSFKQIRKELKVSDEFKFNFLSYSQKIRRDKQGNILPAKNPEDEKFAANFSYEILKALDFLDKDFDCKFVDDIAFVLSMYKTDDNRLNAFEEMNMKLSEDMLQNLLKINVSKFGFLSVKAMQKILPFMLQGERYDIACKNAGYNHSQFEHKKQFQIDVNSEDIKEQLANLTSPVVKRSVAQTIKVLNAIIHEYGSPTAINIELAREMSKDWKERQQITKEQKTREEKREEYRKILQENGILSPTDLEILKYRLYEEQNGKCAYLQVSFLSVFGNIKNVLQNNNTQIDHIIPFSKCFDDSLNNKVLALTSENQNKKNCLPYEYFGKDKERLQKFVEYVSSLNISEKKKQNLLKKSLSDEEEQELNSRALNDTKYSSRFMMNLFDDFLQFSAFASKRPVQAVNGRMTDFLRKIWNLKKDRFASDKHHIQDAVIVALTTNGMIQKVSRFLQLNKYEVVAGNGKVKQLGIKFPYENFKRELQILMGTDPRDYLNELAQYGYTEEELTKVKPIMISRMPTRKLKGQIHKETIHSTKLSQSTGKNIYTVKTDIKKLELDDNDEIKGYPEEYKLSDSVLYNALRNKLLEAKQKILNGTEKLKSSEKLGKIAFSEPFYKFAKNGKLANQVKSVKLQSVSNGGIFLERGFVENASIIRTDVFYKKGKHYLIPVYVSDYYKKELPKNAIKADTPREDWDLIDNTYEFKFSLYPNDLIYIKKNTVISGKNKHTKDQIKLYEGFFYFNSTHSANASIKIFNHDKSFEFEGIGVKTGVKIFEKYQVDMLGSIHKITKEKRLGFK